MNCQSCGKPAVVKPRPVEVMDFDGPVSRQAMVCGPCRAQLNPDIWVAKQFWDALNPRVKFAKLPRFR